MRLPVEVGGDKFLIDSHKPSESPCIVAISGITHRVIWAALSLLALFLPISVWATADIARAVETFCAPQPSVPAVTSCSTCHSSVKQRGVDDLTDHGQWATSSATYGLYCADDEAQSGALSDAAGEVSAAGLTAAIQKTDGAGQGFGMGRGGVLKEDELPPSQQNLPAKEGASFVSTLRRLLNLSARP